MRNNQKGTFYGPEGVWLMLIMALIVGTIPIMVDIYENGVWGWWTRFTAPLSTADACGVFWSGWLSAMVALGYIAGGFIAFVIVFVIGYWTLNYFWFERKEPNLKCRIFGHHGVERDNHIVCPMCGKDYGEYKVWSTLDKETGEEKHYGGFR